jgi:hypothetical protein
MRLSKRGGGKIPARADVEKRVLADNPNEMKRRKSKPIQYTISVTLPRGVARNKAVMNTNKITSMWNLLAILLVISPFLASGEDLLDIVKPGKLIYTARTASL